MYNVNYIPYPLAAAVNFCHVLHPTIPSCTKSLFFWNFKTELYVLLPKIPSIEPGLYPIVFNASWRTATYTPLLPRFKIG